MILEDKLVDENVNHSFEQDTSPQIEWSEVIEFLPYFIISVVYGLLIIGVIVYV